MALLLTLLGLAALEDEAPLIGRPREHFYGAVGEQVRITLAVSRTEVRVEEELTLTLRIHSASNPAKLQRPDLRELDEYAAAFHIDDLDDGPEQPASERFFRYRLRPKHDRVREVPALLYRYYQPKLRYFATTASAENISLNVLSRPESDQAVFALDAPDSLLNIVTGADVHERREVSVAWAFMLLAWLAPMAVCAGVYAVWRWRNPDAARLARLRRHRVVRQALDALSARPSADAAAAAIRMYLQLRLDLPWRAQTAAEMLQALAAAGVNESVRQQAQELFSACDAARFAPPGSTHADIAALGRRLILRIEENP